MNKTKTGSPCYESTSRSEVRETQSKDAKQDKLKDYDNTLVFLLTQTASEPVEM